MKKITVNCRLLKGFSFSFFFTKSSNFLSVFHSRPHAADFELTQLQEKLRETELVMENIVSSAHHSPDRWVTRPP